MQEMKNSMEEKLPAYGGQALIEGVMMRGKHSCAMAVRAPDQSIVVETEKLGSIYQSRIAQLPFVRGLITLWDALALGIRALVFSANIQAPEDEKIEGGMLALTLVPSLLFAVAVFMLLPIGIAYLAERFLAWNAWQSNLLEGFVRLGLLLAYLAAIRRVADIRRVYMYHGAEHKTINAFEDGAELNIEGVRPYSRQHPRCGTAFLLTVFVFSILLFSAIGPLPMLTRIISRLVLLPLLASLAYEYIRFTGTLRNHTLAKILMAPNLWLQNMTTAEPDDDMLAIAIAAFKAMYSEEQRLAAEASAVST
jgi:uncharacterized protein YqhQ